MQAGLTRGRHAAPPMPSGPRLWRTWTPGAARVVAVVLVAALALVAWWWWHGRPRPIDPVSAVADSPAVDQQSASEAILTVHVIGRVHRPGIVTVPVGARVADAIAAAGGLTDRRLRSDLNLARLVVDGEQIDVRRTRRPDPTGPNSPGSLGQGAPSVVNLNLADAQALDALPGIGPVLADRIIAWREANGPFPSVDVLGEVSGIGPAILERLRPLVSV